MADVVDVQVGRPLRAPALAVWAVLNDLERLPEWLEFASALEQVSSPKAIVGATYTVKPRRPYEPKTRWRVTEVSPPRRQVQEGEMPLLRDVTSTIELTQSPDGTARVSVHWRGEPSNRLGRLMRPVLQKQIEAAWTSSLEALDTLAGREAAGG